MLGDLELKNDDWVKAKETFRAAGDATDGKDSYATLSLVHIFFIFGILPTFLCISWYFIFKLTLLLPCQSAEMLFFSSTYTTHYHNKKIYFITVVIIITLQLNIHLICLLGFGKGNWNYFAALRNEKRAPKLEATHLEKAKELYTRVCYIFFLLSICHHLLSVICLF